MYVLLSIFLISVVWFGAIGLPVLKYALKKISLLQSGEEQKMKQMRDTLSTSSRAQRKADTTFTSTFCIFFATTQALKP